MISLRVGGFLLGLTTTSSSTCSYLRWRYTPHYWANSQQYSLQPRAPKLLPAYQTALQLGWNIFIAEISFWLGVALTNSVHLQEQVNSTQEGPTSSRTTLELTTASSSASSYLRWRYPPHYRVQSRPCSLQEDS